MDETLHCLVVALWYCCFLVLSCVHIGGGVDFRVLVGTVAFLVSLVACDVIVCLAVLSHCIVWVKVTLTCCCASCVVVIDTIIFDLVLGLVNSTGAQQSFSISDV